MQGGYVGRYLEVDLANTFVLDRETFEDDDPPVD